MKFRLLSCIVILALLFPHASTKAQTEDSWLNAYLQPGETVVTLAQGLEYQGKVYKIHYFTTGSQRTTESVFIGAATPQSFQKDQITAVLISSNGQVITDEALCEKILILYRAAYYLYLDKSDPLFGSPEIYNEEMENFIRWTPVEQFGRFVKNLFGNKETEYTEAMRGVLSPQVDLPQSLKESAQATASLLTTVDNFGDAADQSMKYLQHDPALRRTMNRFINQYTPIVRKTDQARIFYQYGSTRINLSNALSLVDIGVKTIWIADLQHDRLALLNVYMDQGGGRQVVDGDLMVGYQIVAAEVENAWLQRGDILLQFVADSSYKLASRMTQDAIAKLYYDHVINLAAKQGVSRVLLYNVGHYFSLGSITYLVGDALFGVSDAFNNFVIGTRTHEIRLKFQSWRKALYNQYNQQTVDNFDGAAAEQYRAAYLLEAYASARTIRLYSDGVESTIRTGIIQIIAKHFKKEDRAQAIKDIRKWGVGVEMQAEEAVGMPGFVPEALRLASNRISLPQLTVDNQDPRFQVQGSPDFMKPVSSGYGGEAVWTYNESASAVNQGIWGISIPEAGRYMVIVFVPAHSDDLDVGYTSSAQYTIHHAEGVTVLTIDQAKHEGRWLDLGIYFFTGRSTEAVTLSDQTLEARGEKAVVFDAVRYIPEEKINELARDSISGWELFWKDREDEFSDWFDTEFSQVRQQFDLWFQEQKARIVQWIEQESQAWLDHWRSEIEKWLADLERQLIAWLENSFQQWIMETCGSAVIPTAVFTGLVVQRRKNRRSS